MVALFIFLGMSGVGRDEGNVTIKESPAPVKSRSVDPGADSSGPSVREVYTNDGPGVVSVDVASSKLGPGGGSGFVLDKGGHIVTNQHVVNGADSVSVRFASGAREQADIVGQDSSTDVAVIKVNTPEKALRPLTLGDSDNIGVGDPVIAIGNPLNVGVSVTTGIVSGTERPIDAPNGYTIDGAVQTDAAISSGNSGGPLIDANGSVIGINSQVASAGGGNFAQGIGFAVPINTVKNVVKQLITEGKVVHGYIGVKMFPVGIEELRSYTPLSEEKFKEKYGLPGNGAIVSEAVKGGPADKAGIAGGQEKEIEGLSVPIGDVIIKVEGKRVSDPNDVISVVNSLEPGKKMKVTVVTPGKDPRQVEMTLGAQPEDS